jgi:hypothetical protein
MTDYIEREAAIDAISEWLMKALHPENMSSYNEGERAAYRTAISEIAELPAADVRPKWISVKERLPEEPGEYIVFIRDPFYGKDEPQDEFNVDASYVTSCFYDKDAGLWREWDNSYYCANLQCVNTYKTYYISHWQPLPEPPKEE